MTMSPASARRPLISDPRRVPVSGHDDHLAPLARHQLEEGWLRDRLAQAHARPPVIPGDGARADLFAGRSPAAASVLVPLVQRPEGLQVLLTRRTDHLRDHAGQISFPGGRAESHDADAVATALREAQEEIGLAPTAVEVIGRLAPYVTVTRFVVTPVVGLLPPGLVLQPDPFEVAEVFEVPLAFLMTPANHRRHQVEVDGVPRQFLSMPWTAPEGLPEGYFIWGATAAMLRNLYHCLQD